ncbi:hypothetical protein Q7P37_000521 [Cladosporium fusiforme]
MNSTVDPSLPPLTPTYPPSKPSLDRESSQTRAIISHLKLQPHIEGGYFVETDRDARRVPNPFTHTLTGKKSSSASSADSDILVSSRAASTTIHYYLTPASPLGAFHRNRGRTVHTLHHGRARYVIIHADEVAPSARPGGYGSAEEDESTREKKLWTGKARVETFVVGGDVLAGERVQWIVEGGKYKASFLLDGASEEGCLISETVVPGFEFADHDFMMRERAEALLTEEQVREMGWMIREA